MRTSALLVSTLILLLCTAAFAASDKQAHSADPDAMPGRILVLPEPDSDPARLIAPLEQMGMRVTSASDLRGRRTAVGATLKAAFPVAYLIVSIDPATSAVEAARRAMKLPGVRAASPDFYRYPLFTPDDPYFVDQQLNMQQVGLERVWNVTFGEGAVIAVIDTGYRPQGLTDPVPNLLDGYDFNGRDDDTTDFVGHGTIVSHVIAEATDNAVGCAGAAPDATIMPLKVFADEPGGALDSDIIDAVNFAVDQGVDVINMSLGGGDDNPVFGDALLKANNSGLFLIAASGNDAETVLTYPARYEGVFSVGSCDTHFFGEFPILSSFSSYGEGLDLVAPGFEILQEGYTEESGVAFYVASGTSMSVPHVSAAVALMIALGGRQGPDRIAEVLRETATRETEGWDTMLGWGELNVTAAVEMYAGPLPNGPPTADAQVVPSSAEVPVQVIFSGTDITDPDGNIVSYEWDLGNGEQLSGRFLEVEFTEPGQYEAVLRVTDAEGRTDSDWKAYELKAKKKPAEPQEESGCGCAVASGAPDCSWILMLLLVLGLIFVRPRS